MRAAESYNERSTQIAKGENGINILAHQSQNVKRDRQGSGSREWCAL